MATTFKKSEITYSNNQVKTFIKNVIESNTFNQQRGITPIAIEVEGIPGIGKTSIMKQIAKELDAHFFLDSFAQNTDPGELTGFPVAETKVTRDGKEEWVSNNILTHYITAGYSVCSGDSYRTSYAMPKKIKEMWEIRNNYESNLAKFEAGEITEKPVEPIIMYIIDDAFRANPLIMQASMEIMESQTCGSWSLPKNTHVILTNNPDDGNYQVSSADKAMSDRYITIKMVWSHEDWSEQAENKIDGRCIIFVLKHHDTFSTKLDENGLIPDNYVSPRMLEKFFNLISHIDDFTNAESKTKISMLGASSIGSKLTGEFIAFINESGHTLPSPEDLLIKYSDDKFVSTLEEVVGSVDDIKKMNKAAISIITRRIKNYLVNKTDKIDAKTVEKMSDRIIKLVDSKQITSDLATFLLNVFQQNNFNKNPNLKQIFKKVGVNPSYTKIMLKNQVNY